MRATATIAFSALVLLFVVPAILAIGETQGSRCVAPTSPGNCNSCPAGSSSTSCEDGNTACLPNFGTCCGCSGDACTGCSSGDRCVRSPDSASGWECSAFSLSPSRRRLEYYQCALEFNNLAEQTLFVPAATEFSNSLYDCVAQRFAQTGSAVEASISCGVSNTYREQCNNVKGAFCRASGFMANFGTMPANMLTLNVTTDVCVMPKCQSLTNDDIIQNLYQSVVSGGICRNASTSGSGASVCITRVDCQPIPDDFTTDEKLFVQISLQGAILAMLVIILVAIIILGIFVACIKK